MSSVTGKMVDFIRDEDIYSSSPGRPAISRLVDLSSSSSSPRASATHQLKHQLDLNGVYTKEILDKDKIIEDLGIAIKKQKDTITYLENKLFHRKGALEEREQELEQVISDRTRLQGQVLEMQAERINLQNDVSALQKQFSASEDCNDSLHKTTLTLQKQLDSRSQTERLLRDELASMTASQVEILSSLAARNQEVDALKLTIKKQREEITQLKSDHQNEIDELERGIKELQAARQRTLADELESAVQKDQIMELQQNLTAAQEKSADLQADLSQRESLVTCLQESSVKREANYAQLQRDLQQSAQDCQTYRTTISELTQRLTDATCDFQQQHGDLSREIASLSSQLATMGTDKQRREDELTSSMTKMAEEYRQSMAGTIQDLQGQMEACKSRLDQEIVNLTARWSKVTGEKEEIRSAMALVLQDFELQKQHNEAKDTHIASLTTRVMEITKEHELRTEELRLSLAKRTQMEEAFRLHLAHQEAEMVKEKSGMNRLLESKDLQVRKVMGELAVVRREAAEEVAALERELETLRRGDGGNVENFNSSPLSHYNANPSEFGSVNLPSVLSNCTTPSFDNLSLFSTEHRLLHMKTQEEADCMESKGIPTLRNTTSIARKTVKPSPGFFYIQDMDLKQRQLELDARNAKRLPHLRTDHPLEASYTKWRQSTPRRSVSCEPFPRPKTPPTPRPKTPKKTFRKKAVDAKDKLKKAMQVKKATEKLNVSVSSVSLASPGGRSTPLFTNAAKHKASISYKIDNTPKRHKKV